MKKIVYILLATLAFSSCDSHFEDLQKNPNNPDVAYPINILHGIVKDSWEKPWSDESKYSQFWVTGYKLYGHQNYMFGRYGMNYSQLRNVDQMVKEAGNQSDPSLFAPYLAIAKFYRAFFYVRMTERLGDIPMTYAMMGSEGNFKPTYDSQKDVYVNCLTLLEQANDDMANCISRKNAMGADLFFNGDLLKWQKSINSFRLRVLMSLSKRISEINVVEQFNQIVSNPTKYPIMTSSDDNMQIVYYGSNDDRYPEYPDETYQHRQRNAIGETYLAILRRTQDPRTFQQMEPGNKVNEGVAGREKMLSSYIGANSGDDMTVIAQGLNNGQYATIKYSLYVTPKGIPTVQLGYPEIQFILAEAINRGWIAGDARTNYDRGITADMLFYGVDQADIDQFLIRNAYLGNNAQGLVQILEQKYVAFFQNSGYQPFLEQRRTGIPAFNVGVGNDNGKIPVRWMYPENELKYNEANLKASLQSQFGGSDDINDKMWLIK